MIWYGLLESKYIAARDCLRTIIDVSKKDLKVAKKNKLILNSLQHNY